MPCFIKQILSTPFIIATFFYTSDQKLFSNDLDLSCSQGYLFFE